MKNAVKWSSVALAVAMANGLIATQAVAQGEGFVEGASATLSNRTGYFNRDFRNNAAGQSKAEETATGFVLDFRSGYTQGNIGLGADVMALAGIKLDSGRGRAGTGLLPIDNDGSVPDEYSEIRGAVKANIAGDTVLRYGFHMLENPILNYEDSRLLPSHYFGYSITNTSIDGLMLEAGRMTDRGDMDGSSQFDGPYRHSSLNIDHDKVTYLGGTYAFTDNLSASLYTSKSEDLWKRHYAGLTHVWDFGNGLDLTTDLSHYQTSDDSPAAAVNADTGLPADYDNKATSLAFTLGAGFHDFTVAYQRMGGDAGFAYDDYSIYLANSVQVVDFNAKDERSWQARYDYDLEGVGIPGLTFMTRYIKGNNIDAPAGVSDSRWERDTEIRYTLQSGFFQGIDLVWRNATVRQDSLLDGGDIDENRLYASYTWNLL
ncbi:OprD family porin [Halopseudomonas xiamenensis]|uniref:OprD family porin n=1 Tax=Halopseudomonas xiamenensis TaxID=157792 RepID=UPI0016293028|nr:OprD family porin [Halopseudomonas xiamenensis]